ncbi:RNA-directed DNA polymerase, eukaryota, reverse transcriptase zinc-binding domain protein [Tanacetum coccineum]
MVKWIMSCVSSSALSICLNGVVHGYFKCGRGLRQRDPISSYLFTLVMEVFSLIMCKNIEDSSEYIYHFGCKELKLSHLCFDDDLLVMCKENEGSVEVIKKSMEEFSQVFGLTPNLGKITIFFGNKKDKEKQDLLEVLPFKCGKLLVRYLGVPLLAKTLGIMDCKVLIDKKNRGNKPLSNAGRYNCLSPNSHDSAQGKARVARKLVCKPKDQDGLECVLVMTRSGVGDGKHDEMRDSTQRDMFGYIIKMKDLWKLSRNLWKNSVKQVFSLTPNLGKSTIFFGNKKGKEKQDLLEVLPFKCGKLLVRYLGVPLLAKTLGIMDCKVLIDKVDKRNKTLSYAGRIQLLASNFSDSAQGKARVARKLVCKPKDQDGLVIYDKWCPNDPLCEFITKTTIYDARIQDDLVIADMVVSDNGKWPDRWLNGNDGSSKITRVPDPYMKPPKAYLHMLDRASRLPPLPEMIPESDPLSSVLSHQKSIIDKYARDKQKMKAKKEKNLGMLWNSYKVDEKQRKMQSGKECNQDAAMPVHVLRVECLEQIVIPGKFSFDVMEMHL